MQGGKKTWLQTKTCMSGSQVTSLSVRPRYHNTPLQKGLEQRRPQEKQMVLILTYFQPSVVLQFSQ